MCAGVHLSPAVGPRRPLLRLSQVTYISLPSGWRRGRKHRQVLWHPQCEMRGTVWEGGRGEQRWAQEGQRVGGDTQRMMTRGSDGHWQSLVVAAHCPGKAWRETGLLSHPLWTSGIHLDQDLVTSYCCLLRISPSMWNTSSECEEGS